jgi:hypothetical protein
MPQRTVTVALAVVSVACPGREPRQSADAAFFGTTAPLVRLSAARAGVPAALLRSVTAAAAVGYDRVVFELASDTLPGYRVQYAAGPVRSCGSGDVVSVAGTARLVVHLEPARAHDDQGNPLPRERDLMLGLASVQQAKLVCDFEGQVEWVLGVATTAPYRVTELMGPARLLVDVKQGP